MADPDREALVRLLFPAAEDVKSPADYEARYSRRDLPKGAMVTRYAPSPTGYMHIGGIYVALINKRVAEQTGGVFFLRIEDTDQKRAIEGALATILGAFRRYDLTPSEGLVQGPDGTIEERGNYGPYTQTLRATIYRDYAISLLLRGLAYPCFLAADEIEEMRKKQLAANVKPGIHGTWSPWRTASLASVEERLAKKEEFVIRLRAPADTSGRVEWKDVVKGVISMPVNDLDIVLLKSDGIPTYHFAHAVDDHLMRTTHVIRGDEWVSSMPIHLQLFQTLEFPLCTYAHVPPIQKIEQVEEVDDKTGEKRTFDSRRKLSKRKDAEASTDFYDELGVPVAATKDYLLNIANSAFEDWRKKNPTAKIEDFPFKLDKLAAGGALSDVVKLQSISKDVIGRMRGPEVYADGLAWAKRYDPPLAALMERDPEFTIRALDIERDTPKGNKRVITWKHLREQLSYFFDELYSAIETFDFPVEMAVSDRQDLVRKLGAAYDPEDSCDRWLEKVREVAVAAGYAPDTKQFKANPTSFKGHVGDVAMIYRVAISGVRQTPDLCQILRVLGPERVRARLGRFS
jgi:glutamyl-tRNA synthetase